MSKRVLALGLLVLVAGLASQPVQVSGEQKAPGVSFGGEAARRFTFDSDEGFLR